MSSNKTKKTTKADEKSTASTEKTKEAKLTKADEKTPETTATEKKEKKPRKPAGWSEKKSFVDAAENEMTISARKAKGDDHGFVSGIRLRKPGEDEKGKPFKSSRGATQTHETQQEALARFSELVEKAEALGWTVIEKETKSRVKDVFADVPQATKPEPVKKNGKK